MQDVALDCLLQHHSKSRLALLASLVQLAIPFCILFFFVLVFCTIHAWQWFRSSIPPDRHGLNMLLKVSTYAVLGFFYTSLAQAALNQLSCYQIDTPIPADTPYPQYLEVRCVHKLT